MKHFFTVLLLGMLSFAGFAHASSEVLKVGIVPEKAPFAYIASKGIVGQYDGFDIAVIKAVADDLGMKLKLESMEFDSLIIALKSGKIDAAISAFTITPERSRAVSFSIPYFFSNLSMVVQSSSSIQKANDMKGKRIVLLQGGTSEVAVKKLGFPYTALKSLPEGIVELKNGKCDVIVMDETIARRFCSDLKGITLREDRETFTPAKFGIAVNKKNTHLLDKINMSLEKLKQSGTIEIFLKKYIN